MKSLQIAIISCVFMSCQDTEQPQRSHPPRDISAQTFTSEVRSLVSQLSEATNSQKQVEAARKLVIFCKGEQPLGGSFPKLLVIPLDENQRPADWSSLSN